ncbi:MAG: hypothetical protein EU539_07495 [Promethearchaeota archaeon]|nr:MAG: hypothetical protein EU539_07495 [Candidatus Lokiarchaeota archaeon]
MKSKIDDNDIRFKIISNPDDILHYIQMGTSIPIWDDFYDTIKHDLRFFNARSIIMEENGLPVSHVLIYSNGDQILYFGYFKVINDNPNKIGLLIKKIVQYAREKNFKLIRGPINIPTIIFGWGFMEEGSLDNLYIGKPINPGIYQELFLQNEFYLKVKEISWEGKVPEICIPDLEQTNLDDYHFFNPKDWDDLIRLKPIFIEINAKNLPPESIITPKIGDLFENYAKFVFKYGGKKMFFFVRYKPTGKIIACGSNIPNLFQIEKKNALKSFVAYTIAIELEYRNKGLSMFIIKMNFSEMKKQGMNHISGPTESSHEISERLAKNLGLKNKRAHLVLERSL